MTTQRARFIVPVVLTLAVMRLPAVAQDEHLGLTEYEVACMPCHGVDGKGDGPRAASLAKPPADLTRIAARHGGSFPRQQIAETIDGRAQVAAHGPRDMPVWGERYRKPVDRGEAVRRIDGEARARIDALVDYLAAIQKP